MLIYDDDPDDIMYDTPSAHLPKEFFDEYVEEDNDYTDYDFDHFNAF